MTSKYDAYWQSKLSDIQRLLNQAYGTGQSAALDVSDIESLGARLSWYGVVRVSNLGIGKASMAHAKALGEVILENRLLGSSYEATGFELRISVGQTLVVRRLDEGPEARRSRQPSKTERHTPRSKEVGHHSAPQRLVDDDYDARVESLYRLIRKLPRYDGRSAQTGLPGNGIYLFFERGETLRIGNQVFDRIVRVGTHIGDGRFPERIRQHYGTSAGLGHKNSSVFRKHLGGAIMRRENLNDPRLSEWLKPKGQSFAEIEKRVSDTLGKDFTFVCFEVASARERLDFERGLIGLLAQHPLGQPSPDWLGRQAAAPEIRASGLWNTQHVAAAPLSRTEFARLKKLMAPAKNTLVIIPCGQAKVWDKCPWLGAIPAADAYTGAPFKVNKEYAEKFADKWVILSAKYGFIEPDFEIPCSYEVTFKKKKTNPVGVQTLRRQREELGLDRFERIIVLGGKEYRAIAAQAFTGASDKLHFPFAGLPLGLAMQATKKAVKNGLPLEGAVVLKRGRNGGDFR